MDEEGLQSTPNHTIHVGMPIQMDEENFFTRLQELKEDAYNETEDIRSLVKELVPTYIYQEKPKECAAERLPEGIGIDTAEILAEIERENAENTEIERKKDGQAAVQDVQMAISG